MSCLYAHALTQTCTETWSIAPNNKNTHTHASTQAPNDTNAKRKEKHIALSALRIGAGVRSMWVRNGKREYRKTRKFMWIKRGERIDRHKHVRNGNTAFVYGYALKAYRTYSVKRCCCCCFYCLHSVHHMWASEMHSFHPINSHCTQRM